MSAAVKAASSGCYRVIGEDGHLLSGGFQTMRDAHDWCYCHGHVRASLEWHEIEEAQA